MRVRLAVAILVLVAASAAADVELFPIFFPTPLVVQPGQTADVDVVFYFVGTDPVSNASLTFAFPDAITVNGASGEAWTCRTSAHDVSCSSPSAGNTLRLNLTISSSLDGGHFVIPTHLETTPSNHLPFAFPPFTIDVYRTFEVSSPDDVGAGTLRDAIDAANARCDGTVPCRIAFTQPMTIHPTTPLPAVTACNLLIDAGTSDVVAAPRAVEISGTRATFANGLEIRSACGVVVQGLAIAAFSGNGIVVAPPDAKVDLAVTIISCSIGTDSAAASAKPNGLRGISIESPSARVSVKNSVIGGNARSGIFAPAVSTLDVNNCRIGGAIGNGASGVYVDGGVTTISGVVAGNGDFGVAIGANAKSVAIEAPVYGNGSQDIDWGLDGPTPIDPTGRMPSVPVLLGASYDAAAHATDVQVFLPLEGRLSVADFLEFFSGETFIARQGVLRDATTFTARLPGDWRGKTIRALTQYRLSGDSDVVSTSELSAPLSIPNAP